LIARFTILCCPEIILSFLTCSLFRRESPWQMRLRWSQKRNHWGYTTRSMTFELFATRSIPRKWITMDRITEILKNNPSLVYTNSPSWVSLGPFRSPT
jgi:hypothetical protein